MALWFLILMSRRCNARCEAYPVSGKAKCNIKALSSKGKEHSVLEERTLIYNNTSVLLGLPLAPRMRRQPSHIL